MTQISLFDYLPKTIDDIKLGLLEDKSIIGPEIEVSDLCDFVGSKVIKSCGNDSFEVICIIDFQKDSDLVYKRFRPLPHNDIGYGEYVKTRTFTILSALRSVWRVMSHFDFTIDSLIFVKRGKRIVLSVRMPG